MTRLTTGNISMERCAHANRQDLATKLTEGVK
ncbi:hypothetical protein FB566_5213 [Stackebrandtia endophytica]|uniref:Uncharacterized protein n=1 Tax=Stackebrandtia endophytica TaxID=1496996 RepID=A0A543B481_9ACTN|nr:hypothetical protein FB566_5213 [Stackebrandtia endophytica]